LQIFLAIIFHRLSPLDFANVASIALKTRNERVSLPAELKPILLSRSSDLLSFII
jgi:hypothetical protein